MRDNQNLGKNGSETTGRSVGRRSFLQAVGAGAAATTFSGVAAARKGKKQSAEAAGIGNALDALLSKGKIRKAAELCEKRGVTHNIATGRMPKFDSVKAATQSDDGISAQDAYKYGDSTITISSWYRREDAEGQPIYQVACQADVTEDDANVVDDAAPKDAVAIRWSETYFQGVSESKSNYGTVGLNPGLMSYEDYHQHGVWAKVADNQHQSTTIAGDSNPESFSVGIDTEIEKLQSGNSFNVTAEYLHNWNPGGAYYVSSFNLGPVGFDFGGSNVYDWRREKTIKV